MAKEQPPWRAGQSVRVLRIGESDDPFVVMFLGPYRGHREHWPTRPPSVPCFGKAIGCRYCARLPLRFYAYAPVLWQDPRTGKFDPWVLQAPANLEEVLRDRSLRGEIWLLERGPGGITAEVTGRYVKQRDPSTLPDPFDIVPVLQRMFQEKTLCLDVDNPNPDRVVPVIPEIEPLVLATPKVHVPIVTLTEEDYEKEQKRLDAARAKAGFPREHTAKNNGKVVGK